MNENLIAMSIFALIGVVMVDDWEVVLSLLGLYLICAFTFWLST